MAEHPSKQMLCITTERQNDTINIHFALHGYYRCRNRWVCSIKDLPSLKTDDLLNDESFIEDVSFKILLHLPPYDEMKSWRSKKVALLLYPSNRNGQNVILFGDQVYTDKNFLQHCSHLSFAISKEDDLFEDANFRNVLAEHVLRYLPISEELCLMRDESFRENIAKN